MHDGPRSPSKFNSDSETARVTSEGTTAACASTMAVAEMRRVVKCMMMSQSRIW
jgi:hypothetical protein